MKRIWFLAPLALLAACGSNSNAPSTDSAKIKMDSPVTMRPIQSPYPMLYSSSFSIDDPKNAETLLAISKAYDNGDLSPVKGLFADTVEFQTATGFMQRSGRDSSVAGMQGYRSSLKAVSTQVKAIMAVKSTDKNEHWVLLWTIEKDTHKNGKIDSFEVQGTWQFDNNGKASAFYQYSAIIPAKK